MRTRWLSLVTVCVLATSIGAAPPELVLPAEVAGQPGEFVMVPAKTTGKAVSWKAIDPGLNLFPVILLKDSKTAVVTASRPGRYRLLAVTAAGDEVSPIAETIVVIGDAPPAPPGPNPPAPTPTGPFRVIWVYESMDAMTPEVQRVMFSNKVTTYLDAKCEKGRDGIAGWRRWDKDVQPDGEWKPIWDATKPKLTTTPCLVVVKGTTVEILPMPKTEDEALATLKKYGGE